MKLAEKRGKDIEKLRRIIGQLVAGVTPPRELGGRPLKGEWRASRDLHIEPDWILIYTPGDDAIRFERTGSHSDVFGK